MNDLWRKLRDPRISILLVLLGGAVGGLVLLYLGWRGVAASLAVPLQVPYLVSGAVAGIACTGAALALVLVHLDRTEAAQERHETAELQREVLRLRSRVAQER